MVLTNMQEMEIRNGVSRMMMNFNANDKVGNVLTSLDSARLFDIIIDDIEKLDQFPTTVEVGSIMTNVLSEYVSEKFEYTNKVLKVIEVCNNPYLIKDITEAVISANSVLPNKVDTVKYCARLKSIIYSWYPEEISVTALMKEASNLWVALAVEVNPSLS